MFVFTSTYARVPQQMFPNSRLIRKHEVQLQPDCGFFSLFEAESICNHFPVFTELLMIASSWNLLLVLAHSDSRTTAAAGGLLIVSLLLGLAAVTPVPASREGEPERACDLAPTKVTEESKVGVEGNGSEKGLTPLEEVKPYKVLKPAWATEQVWDI